MDPIGRLGELIRNRMVQTPRHDGYDLRSAEAVVSYVWQGARGAPVSCRGTDQYASSAPGDIA